MISCFKYLVLLNLKSKKFQKILLKVFISKKFYYLDFKNPLKSVHSEALNKTKNSIGSETKLEPLQQTIIH